MYERTLKHNQTADLCVFLNISDVAALDKTEYNFYFCFHKSTIRDFFVLATYNLYLKRFRCSQKEIIYIRFTT